eukprot:1180265-Prorocentrum_minimum.AAC.2
MLKNPRISGLAVGGCYSNRGSFTVGFSQGTEAALVLAFRVLGFGREKLTVSPDSRWTPQMSKNAPTCRKQGVHTAVVHGSGADAEVAPTPALTPLCLCQRAQGYVYVTLLCVMADGGNGTLGVVVNVRETEAERQIGVNAAIANYTRVYPGAVTRLEKFSSTSDPHYTDVNITLGPTEVDSGGQ